MYKLFLTDKMLKLHQCYFENNIKTRFEVNSVDYKKLSSDWLCDAFDGAMALFKKYSNELAIGDFRVLQSISQNYENITSSLNKDELGTLNDVVYSVFNYDGFINNNFGDRLCNKLKMDNGKEKFNKTISTAAMSWIKAFITRNALYISEPEKKFTRREEYNQYVNSVIYPSVFESNFRNVEDSEWIFWDAYAFVFLLGIKVCPYCNQQFVYPVVTSKGKMRGSIDHFLPKSKYPYLSMSIYNWIPCCSNCNSYLKRTFEFSFDDFNLYDDNLSDYFRYVYDFKRSGIGASIEIMNEKVEKYCSIFKWRELADFHIDIAKRLLQARLCYCDEYLTLLGYSTLNLYDSVEELKAAVIGYIEKPDQINNECLGKMKYDLACDLGMIDGKDEDDGNR